MDRRTVFASPGVRLATILIGAALLAVIPTSIFSGMPSICLFKNLFGAECLGCGMVRAASCLAHGNFAGAAELNGLVFAVATLACMAAVRDISQLRKRRG